MSNRLAPRSSALPPAASPYLPFLLQMAPHADAGLDEQGMQQLRDWVDRQPHLPAIPGAASSGVQWRQAPR